MGDTDTNRDVYERGADGSLRLISPPGAGAFDAQTAGWSRDGSRVLFVTAEPNAALGDTDAFVDVYEVRWGVPGNVSPPGVSGTGRVGQTLTCATGVWAGDGFTLTVEWLRDGVPIAGQSATAYGLAATDAGRAISCRVTGRNVVGEASATSGAVTIAPHRARGVRIAGTSVVGTRLTCDRSGILGATSVTVTWRRNGRVTGVRGARYRLGRRDLGARITCRVLARNPVGSLTDTSLPRRIPTRCRVPVLRGRTLAQARTLAGLAGCRTRVVRASGSGVSRGSVLRTKPAARTSRPNGATVTLVIRR